MPHPVLTIPVEISTHDPLEAARAMCALARVTDCAVKGLLVTPGGTLEVYAYPRSDAWDISETWKKLLRPAGGDQQGGGLGVIPWGMGLG